MTYRRDSNVFNGYGSIIPFTKKAKEVFNKNKKWLPFEPSNFKSGSNLVNRDKDIVWMVSHCQTDSKREDVVKKLKGDSKNVVKSGAEGFFYKALFLTFPHEKTAFQRWKVVSEAIFLTNWGHICIEKWS